MPIFKSDEGYEGTFNTHEHGVDAVVKGKTRELVEWKLRKEFAARLEKLAHTAALLRRFAADVDWYEETEDNVISEKIPRMFKELAQGIEELRDCEPALALCATQDEKSRLHADDGRIIEVNFGDWSDSTSALEDRVRRAGYDAHMKGAASKAIEALFAAGVTGPRVADTADYLSQLFMHEFFDKCDDKDAAVSAHVQTIVEMSKLNCWKAYADNENNAYWSLISTYRDRMKDALAAPDARRASRRRAKRMSKAIAIIVAEGKRETKRAVANKTARRSKKRAA